MQEMAIVIVRHEADFLALLLLRELHKAVVRRNLTHLIFGEAAQRKQRPLQHFGGQLPQEIGLIFLCVNTFLEEIAVTGLRDAGVVAGGDVVAAQLVGHLQHPTPLDDGIAEHAGIRGPTLQILVDKILDDRSLEEVADVKDMVFKAEFLGQVFRLENGIHGAAALLAGDAALRDLVEGAEGHADQLIPLLHQQHSGDTAVNAAAHGYQYTFSHLSDSQRYCTVTFRTDLPAGLLISSR